MPPDTQPLVRPTLPDNLRKALDALVPTDDVVAPSTIIKRDDLEVDMNATIDLVNRQVEYEYALQNLRPGESTIELLGQGIGDTSKRLQFSTDERKIMRHRTALNVTQLSRATMLAEVRPYLVIRDEDQRRGVMVSKHDIDIKVKMPGNARIVKSNIPLRRESPDLAVFQLTKAPIVPPIHIWYTTAAEQVSMTKSVEETKETAVISINVTNEGTGSVSNLKFMSRFSLQAFSSIPEMSDGEFHVADPVMGWWEGKVNWLRKGSIGLTYQLRKNHGASSASRIEVLLFNKDGDLLAVE